MSPPHVDFAADCVMIAAAADSAFAERAVELADAGIAVMELAGTAGAANCRDALADVREAVGDRLLLQVDAAALAGDDVADHKAMIRDLRPEAVLVNLRALCPGGSPDADTSRFLSWLGSEAVWPQYLLFDAVDLQRFDLLRKRGLLADERPHCLFVPPAASGDDPAWLDALLDKVDCTQFPWSARCDGDATQSVAQRASERGGHLQVDAAGVARVMRGLEGSSRRPASATEVRERLLAA